MERAFTIDTATGKPEFQSPTLGTHHRRSDARPDHTQGHRPVGRREAAWRGRSPVRLSLRALRRPLSRLLLLGLLGLLSACAGLRPVGPEPMAAPAPSATQWQAQRPHEGSTGDLTRWWQQFDDPVLAALIEAAQRESASLAQAATRIAEAQAAVVRAGATALPSLDASASRVRGPITFGGPPILRTQDQLQLQSSWEIDLFGGQLRERQASAARLDARAADWHDARVSVAAELASQYVALRACERQVVIDEADLASRRESERLTALAASAGFQSGGQAALARAASADQASRLQAQQAECQLAIKALVALTALDEPELRRQLSARTAALPQPSQFRVETLPAQLISQRPDLAAAERELAAASADIGVAIADRYPRLSLMGSIGPLRFEANGVTLNTTSWSLGPSISLPLFDGGRRASAVQTAHARHALALANYRSRIRTAIQEVEQAMVRLASTGQREVEATQAARSYRESMAAAQTRWQSGLGSLLELEEARRLTLQADTSLAALRRDRVVAWIALYRALGGGWSNPPDSGADPGKTALPTNRTPS
jgi:multidrug efflux system outer membrane protein